MSELIQKNEKRPFRIILLTNVSILALVGYIASAPNAIAEDNDRPTVWIDVGGQLNRLIASQEAFAPPFLALTPSDMPFPQSDQKPPRYGFDISGALTFQPQETDWHFSAALRYGRSNGNKHAHQQSYPVTISLPQVVNGNHFYSNFRPFAARFTNIVAKPSETHMVLDFQAGKDLGIGLFGHTLSSFLNVGVRFAQFTSKSRTKLAENPDWHFHTTTTLVSYHSYYFNFQETLKKAHQPYHTFEGTFRADRSFSGLGPSISWNSSETIAGNAEKGELLFDWGVNAAVLFGRQKARTHHQTTAHYHYDLNKYYGSGPGNRITEYRHPATPDHTRSRSVIVPNVGAFAGLSFRYTNAKVSFGYKADFFFGAMDGGIDVRHIEDIGFHGPYASVSIGLGG